MGGDAGQARVDVIVGVEMWRCLDDKDGGGLVMKVGW